MAGGTRTDPVLITGCSSGIGRAAAVSLHHAGLRVYATARRGLLPRVHIRGRGVQRCAPDGGRLVRHRGRAHRARTGEDTWNDTAAGSFGETAVGSGTDPYAANKAADGVSFSWAASGPLARLGSDAHDIAKVITRAVTVQRPRTRYLINPVAKGVVTMNRLLPGRAYDAVIRRQYGLPG